MADIIIEDEYIEEMQSFSKVQASRFEVTLTEYMAVMSTLNAEGIVKGQTADALKMFIETAKSLKGKVQEISELFQQLLESYLSDINDADKELY